jgi:hypothetical protein
MTAEIEMSTVNMRAFSNVVKCCVCCRILGHESEMAL